jgi:hypothetical protein
MRLRVAAFTLAFGLGVVGLVSAQESGTWFTRWFTPAAKTESAKKVDAKADPQAPPPASTSRLKQAKADLERRQAVCNRLIEIADASGDDDLRRKAEQLDQRAWDLYTTMANRLRDAERPLGEVSARDVGLTRKGDR